MNATATAILVVFALVATTYATVIHLENREGLAAVCKGTVVVTQCTTTTATGFLLWRNGSNSSISFTDTASVDDSKTLGSMTTILDRKDLVGNAFVYISTAKDIIMEETNFTCSDGKDPKRIDISANSPSRPSWAYSACRFSQDSVQLSWNPPVVAPQCCKNYTVQLSTNQLISSNTSSINVSIGELPVDATVHCIDFLGDNTSSQTMTIHNSTIVGVTIEVLNISCDTNTDYNILWTTSPPSEGVCTPPITMSTIKCTTSSIKQSSSNTRSMMCSVPATEILIATVIVTNEAGVTTEISKTADAQAQNCLSQRSNSCIMPSPSGEPSSSLLPSLSPEPVCNQPVPFGIPAICLLVLVIILLIVLAVCVCIMLMCYKRKPPCSPKHEKKPRPSPPKEKTVEEEQPCLPDQQKDKSFELKEQKMKDGTNC